MHRHGYKGRKFGRERDQRRALLKGLATSLVIHGKIETTLPKAKETLRYTEKLITKAKKGDLHNRRQIIAKLGNIDAANKLVEIVVTCELNELEFVAVMQQKWLQLNLLMKLNTKVRISKWL